MLASKYGHFDIVELLIKHSDVNAIDHDGNSALLLASMYGNFKIEVL